jgi:hypothetical protein
MAGFASLRRSPQHFLCGQRRTRPVLRDRGREHHAVPARRAAHRQQRHPERDPLLLPARRHHRRPHRLRQPLNGDPVVSGGHVGTAVKQPPAQGLSAFAPGCSGTLLKLGACPSEAGAAGTTAAQVKDAWEGAAWILSSAIPFGDLLDAGLSALFGDDAAGTLGSLLDDTCATGIGGESFTAGTGVLLASGKTVPISQLKVGDKVKAVNAKTGKADTKTVQAVLVHYDTDLYDLTVKTKAGAEVIDTTSNHLFYDPSLNKKWVEASELKKGEHLQTPDGQAAVVVGGSVPADHDGWMWDLTVQDDHDFYVEPAVTLPPSRAGPSDVAVLVHNCGPSGSDNLVLGSRYHGLQDLTTELGGRNLLRDADWREQVSTAADLLKLGDADIRVAFSLDGLPGDTPDGIIHQAVVADMRGNASATQ